MFKWSCLAVAAVFLAAIAWMVNDIRLELRQSVRTVNDHLPPLLEKTKATTDVVSEHLPDIVQKTRTTAETVSELAEDIRQLKELAGVSGTARDKNLVAYADGALAAIEASGATIGLKKTLGGSGLKNAVPAREWAVGARKEAVVLTVLVRSKKELATRLTKNKFGSPWYVQVGDGEPVAMLDWLRANHSGSKELGE